MNDETKDELMRRTREWLQSCVNAATRSGVPEEADLEAFILAHIDGELARQAAAIASAREEQREACALDAEERVGCASTYDEIRSVPLDATPLGDELRDEREVSQSLREQLIAAEAERDALRARVAELEAQNAEISTEARNLAYALEAADERQAEADKKLLDVHDSLHRECNGPVDLGREIRDMRSALEQRVGDLRKMYESAERDAAARYDCKGGPGTTAPACGGCVTCLHRVIEKAEADLREAHERLDEFGMKRDGTTATVVEGIAAMRAALCEYQRWAYEAEVARMDLREAVEELHDLCEQVRAGRGLDTLRARAVLAKHPVK